MKFVQSNMMEVFYYDAAESPVSNHCFPLYGHRRAVQADRLIPVFARSIPVLYMA